MNVFYKRGLCAAIGLFALMMLVVPNVSLHAQSFDYARMAPHPRLLMDREGQAAVQTLLEKDHPAFQTAWRVILAFSQQTLDADVLTYQKEGRRLLAVSREALKRIFYLSFSYRMTGRTDFAFRAIAEMKAVCAFSDWNPSHFLDVGEMTMAVALGYDWLYDLMSESDRQAVCQALLKNGLEPSFDTSYNGFLTSANNWNQVCNAGMVFGALALYEEAPDVAKEVIERACATVGLSMQGYAPDGNYPEGYVYWCYGTTCNVLLLGALESALGHDAGLSRAAGFMDSARFMTYMTGTTGLSYNFSDSREQRLLMPAMFWFAARLDDPSLLWNELDFLQHEPVFTPEEERFLPMVLIYGAQLHSLKIKPPKTPLWSGQGINPVVLVRTDWKGNKGCYLGLKGGKAVNSHGHMDAGSFVFDAKGVRWAMDLGMQEYYSLEKEGVGLWNSSPTGQRWDVFRYNNFAHNTLTVNGAHHITTGAAPITEVIQTKKTYGAVLDLQPALGQALRKATRRIVLERERWLLVTDSLENGPAASAICWTLVTPAETRILDDHTVLLKKDGQEMRLQVAAEVPFTIELIDNTPPHAYDAPNPDSRRVQIHFNLAPLQAANMNVKLF